MIYYFCQIYGLLGQLLIGVFEPFDDLAKAHITLNFAFLDLLSVIGNHNLVEKLRIHLRVFRVVKRLTQIIFQLHIAHFLPRYSGGVIVPTFEIDVDLNILLLLLFI